LVDALGNAPSECIDKGFTVPPASLTEYASKALTSLFVRTYPTR